MQTQDSPISTLSWGTSIRERICEIQPLHESQNMSRSMSSKQPQQLRPTVDALVGELSHLDANEGSDLASLLEQLTERLTGSMEAILEARLATLGETLASEFEEKIDIRLENALAFPVSAPGPTLAEFSRELESMQDRVLDKLDERLSNLSAPPASPTMEELSREMESMQNRVLDRLAERLSTSLQTAIAVQLAPLSDDLPDRLTSAVASMASTSQSPSVALTQLTEQFERLENRSMANMTARMTAGLQAAIVNEMEPFAEHINQKLSATIASVVAHSSESKTVNHDGEEHSPHDAELQSQLASAMLVQERLRVELEQALAESIMLKERDAELLTEIDMLREVASTHSDDQDQTVAGGAMIVASGGADEELLDRLDRATCEIVDLRNQNEELHEQISRLQVTAANAANNTSHIGHESMTWEERKKMLMNQLNAEMDDEDNLPVIESQRVEMEDVIRATEVEIDRRDREIAELRSLLEQQSNAHQGMAVGAAAVAQLIETDELVQQEREKLRAIQAEWENKFRQTEIEISMERAKLARERLEMEDYKQQQEHILASLPNVTTRETLESTKAKSRKWLSRLGLKEEN